MTKSKQAGMNPREAIYGFASWLTCRKGTLSLGEKHEAAGVADLVRGMV